VFTKIGRIKPGYEVVRCLCLQIQSKGITVLTHALTANSFPQSMIARLVLNLLKPRDTIAVYSF